MKRQWVRPAVRIVAALSLPVAVPGILTGLLWALPGDPASIICPPEVCTGTEALARRWNLDRGAWGFFAGWLRGAAEGDFGRSWRLQQGVPVADLLRQSIPNTAILVGLAFALLLAGAVAASLRLLPRGADPLLQAVGLVPALVLALVAAAAITLRFGAGAYGPVANAWRIGMGAVALGLADAALSGTVAGVRSTVESERRRRYVQMGVLRGEGELENSLPNVLPALVGQLRARTLTLLSGAVVVEVVLKIDGLGDLLWGGTLTQDFGVVLAAATGFAVLSALLLLGQAVIELAVLFYTRWSPVLVQA